ncbi:hypothetical protein [Celerinatantimonas diazotrophica]|uniref:Porin n=1 Tax=Celerinatantimonas diazotrophica TaxID=412034 RepID=A0A4R1J7M8_9GAMM|nr:hypothetical protein [Celerinatantimonas diazotrophica]TCK46351.1 hypothetical protein EV690_3627 [Celerinatantimonas diazotrophica]CAG9295275.1 hypothetical protein CEDIAZO_00387 [Celerinatantimonas diazotrophica]
MSNLSRRSYINSLALLLLVGSSSAFGQIYKQQSDVVGNYLNDNLGSTVPSITNTKDKSRWYATFRIKGGNRYYKDNNSDYIQFNSRLRGKKYISDHWGIIGDLWFRAIENYNVKDGTVVNKFDDFNETTKWEQMRIGFENDTLGAFMFGKHTTTWSFFTVDMGSQGLYDTQAEAAGKDSGKFLYKKFMDNGLFLAASYDRNSHIWGADIGYQQTDIYQIKPNTYGLYMSIHNGQPAVFAQNKPIIGNVDINKTKAGHTSNSDTPYARTDPRLFTYAISSFYNYNMQYRLVSEFAYSRRDNSESYEQILSQGYAKGGLGFSGTVGIERFPKNADGFAYVLYNTWDELGKFSVTPQVEYWFGSPNLRAWLSYTWEQRTDDNIRLEAQWDF